MQTGKQEVKKGKGIGIRLKINASTGSWSPAFTSIST